MSLSRCFSIVRRSFAVLAVALTASLCAAQTPVAIPPSTHKLAADNPTQSQQPAVAEEEEEASTPPKPGHDGIKVHGHWIIDVKNPDGTLAEHRDFQNAYTDPSNFLPLLLMGKLTPGEPLITLYPAPQNNAICSATVCVLTQSRTGVTGSSPFCSANSDTCSYGMTIAQPAPNPNTGAILNSLILSGQFTATRNGTVARVETDFVACGAFAGQSYAPSTLSPYSPANCVNNTNLSATTGSAVQLGGFAFTATTLTNPNTQQPSPLNVTPGQVVLFTVTLSFS